MPDKNKDPRLNAWYPFDEENNIGKDGSGNGMDALPKGADKPAVRLIDGRMAAVFAGGSSGNSYFELPAEVLQGAGDENGLTVSAWVRPTGEAAAWQRIFDFGHDQNGPYLFLTRFMRGICFNGKELPADAGRPGAGEWTHIALTITPTGMGNASLAGPRLYINGELAADGLISQTSSGNYKALREFLAALSEKGTFDHNYIGKSQFAVDPDFEGAIADFRIYKAALSEEEVIELLCQSLTDEAILELADKKFLKAPQRMITKKAELPEKLMNGRVALSWEIEPKEVLAGNGELTAITEATPVHFTVHLTRGNAQLTRNFTSTAVPKNTAPYEFTVFGKDRVMDISKTLFGLFFEDINHSADGGIYAEMVQNRSFENFTFKVYDPASGKNGASLGKEYHPLQFWFGETDKVTVKDEGGLNAHFHVSDPECNPHYLDVPKGTLLQNHGFCDNNGACAMPFQKDASYVFSIYAKAEAGAAIEVSLQDEDGNKISDTAQIEVTGGGRWKKYTIRSLTAHKSCHGQLGLQFMDRCQIDMVSMMPADVWGHRTVKGSSSAHRNYKGNSNYRLRNDLMQTLFDMNPKFLRFPGGCISEGSYIWDNVYDWKDSVGNVAIRKENYNVWGYNMTMGLGYMEYFQMAEDLNAEPLPVMACGVLCQARSDYANPAGGALREKYIHNFTDLIDFAISTDFEKNKWAALRKKMGHEEPFGLHYLGVGNENWGDEFFANFEIFYHEIQKHLKENYPGYPLTIVSTAGAQADDDAYQIGWQFLCGAHKGADSYEFTDGETSKEEGINWYRFKKDYLDTIVDEHYYRSNAYLLENVDRYNYYQRAYKGNKIDDRKSPKVFVGEYASTDKNTLRGSIAEAATMVGYERNSDVVRMASTAPLFNQITTDGTYRWTPDCIWFDQDSVWRTPTYYVQQLFMSNIGDKLLRMEERTYEGKELRTLHPHGGFTVSAAGGRICLKELLVTSNAPGKEVLFHQDFTSAEPADERLRVYGSGRAAEDSEGFLLDGTDQTSYLYMDARDMTGYTVTATAYKLDEGAVIEIGAGLLKNEGELDPAVMTLTKYCVGDAQKGTGIKVYKDGKEGYTMGDYSSSVYAGNLRACHMENVPAKECITAVLDFGGRKGNTLEAGYERDGQKYGSIVYKLEEYNRDIFASATDDDKFVYMKLVNTDDQEKTVKICMDHLKVRRSADWIVLSGDMENASTANVNTSEKELIVPEYRKIPMQKSGDLQVDLPPQSLNVIRLRKDGGDIQK